MSIRRLKLKIKELKAKFKKIFINKSKLKLQSIKLLSEDIPLMTNEIYIHNDFYGHATNIKKFVGFDSDYKLKAAIEHAAFLDSFWWGDDINAPLPAIFTMPRRRIPIIKKLTNKKVFAIGPYIHYAEHILNDQQITKEKKRLGNNLLIFPAHSTHHVDTNYDTENFCKKIKQMGKDFDSVRVCLYWKDILRGFDKIFKDNNLECVSAGHIYDPYFLPRLKSILELSTVTASNLFGTHIGYSVYMNKPHYIFKDEIEFLGNQADVGDGVNETNLEFEKLFGNFNEKITPEQYKFIDNYLGLADVKTKDELKAILFEIEEDYIQQYIK